MGDGGEDKAQRYPEALMPIAGELEQSYRRFVDLRESFLLDYGYQTARAYWTDLESWADWATERGKDVLALTERDVTQYRALLRRRGYSESTIRRRVQTLGRFRKKLSE